MAIYLVQGSYTLAAIAALVKKPDDRSAAVRELAESLGGKMVGFWFSSGDYDFVGVIELPDLQAAAAFAAAASAGGAVHGFKTTPLLSWSDGVAALKKAAAAKYRPPTKSAK